MHIWPVHKKEKGYITDLYAGFNWITQSAGRAFLGLMHMRMFFASPE